MSVDLTTEVGADTKKFDAAIDASAKNAKDKLNSVSRGFRAAGAAASGFVERLKNAFSMGPLGAVAAILASIVSIIGQIRKNSQRMFADAVDDAKTMANDLKAVNQLNNKRTDKLTSDLDLLRSLRDKKTLTQEEMVRGGLAMTRLQEKVGATNLRFEGNATTGYRLAGLDAGEETKIEEELLKRKIEAIDAEIKAARNTMDANTAKAGQVGNAWWNRLTGRESEAESNEKIALAKENMQLSNEIMALDQQRRELMEKMTFASHVNLAKEMDRADKAAAEAQKEREKQLEEERKKRKKDQHELAQEEIKRLEAQKKEIKIIGQAESQIFTNSLTQRGGFASGATVWTNDRYQQNVMASWRQTIATLDAINRRIEALKKI